MGAAHNWRERRAATLRELAHRLRRGGSIGHPGVHPTASIPPGSHLRPRTAIGCYTRMEGPCTIRGVGDVRIGAWCAIGRELLILSSNHDLAYPNVQLRLDRELGIGRIDDIRGGVEIANNVWIGDRVTIVAGARIGNGAAIGAGSVVTGSIPPYAVAAGVPARVLRRRFDDETCDVLDELGWWEWPRERILRNTSFFATRLTDCDPSAIRDLVVP